MIKNCSSLLIILFLFVSNLFSMRESSYPFVSGDSFRAYCDHIFDETNQSLQVSSIKSGDTIFLKADPKLIIKFFTHYYPKINAKFIIVSHNADHSIPGLKTSYDAPVNFNLLKYIEEQDSKIIRWFAQNIDGLHPKLHSIPIALANRHWEHGNIDNFKLAMHNAPSLDQRGNGVYLNFSITTNQAVRGPIFDFFKNKTFCINDKKRTHQDYLFQMRKNKFVLCPPGNGIDCHRTWEALLVGCIPIIQHSTLDSLYEDLPVIFISSWDEVTEEFLEKEYTVLKGRTFNTEKLYFDYWATLINSYKSLFIK